MTEATASDGPSITTRPATAVRPSSAMTAKTRGGGTNSIADCGSHPIQTTQQPKRENGSAIMSEAKGLGGVVAPTKKDSIRAVTALAKGVVEAAASTKRGRGGLIASLGRSLSKTIAPTQSVSKTVDGMHLRVHPKAKAIATARPANATRIQLPPT